MMESKKNEEEDNGANGTGGGGGGWNNIDFSEIEMGDRIGGGGVGVIYKGWYKNEAVALKTLFDTRIDENLKKEYMDELLVMSKVKHSNIVTFLGACMVPPNLCFVMEMCQSSLFNVLHVDRRRFSERDIIQMAVDVGSAMEYLHSLKPAIIHRDLKSHNVLQDMDGKLKVCDFGLVKVRNTQAGTPAYMAPELLENKSFNKTVDVYAYGILLCEIFTGEMPFYGVDVPTIRSRVVDGQRPHVPSFGIPPRCLKLINDCWSQRADDRPLFPQVVDELLEIYDTIPENRYTDDLQAEGGGDALDALFKK